MPCGLGAALASVPAALTARPHWVCWRLESRNGKLTKVPINPHTGGAAATNRATTWASFAHACQQAETDGVAGVGYVFSPDDGLTGVDLDKCRDPGTGDIEQWAQDIVAELNSYTEISPSKRGLHILLAGKLPDGERRKGHIEMYDRGRYFTVTGDHLPGTPIDIQPREAELWNLHCRIFGAFELPANSASVPPQPLSVLSDHELIRRASSAKNGAKFSRLWAGDWQSEGYASQSDADSALCTLLAFWTNKDGGRIAQLFRASGLYRPKWEEKHFANGHTYGEETIARSLTVVSETYGSVPERTKAVRSTAGTEALSGERAEDGLSPLRFHRTDAGNAKYFAARYGDLTRYDHRRGRWLLWREHRWCPDADAEICRLAKASVQDRLRAAAECDTLEDKKETAKWAFLSESRSKLDALLTLAQSEQPLTDSGDQWDTEPMLLCAPNGVVDLHTGALRAGRPADRLTLSTGVSFDAGVPAPRWERFLLEVFNGDQDLIQFVQRAIGYSLSGETTEQCLFLLYGGGANGKSTLVNTLKHVLGEYAWNMPFSTIESDQRASIPNDLAALVGRRFVIASETNDGTRLNESRIKALTGCDRVSARFLHQEFFEFVPVSKLWLCVNHKPIVRDDSHGFWRRIRLIPFRQQFPGDKTLSKELLAEGPGILAWAVRGCLEWHRLGGLFPPNVVTEATAAYARDSDPLSEFIDEFCEVDPAAQAGAAEMYAHYTHWATHRGLSERERLTSTMFGRKMGERFPSGKMRSGKVYRGVARRSA